MCVADYDGDVGAAVTARTMARDSRSTSAMRMQWLAGQACQLY